MNNKNKKRCMMGEISQNAALVFMIAYYIYVKLSVLVLFEKKQLNMQAKKRKFKMVQIWNFILFYASNVMSRN